MRTITTTAVRTIATAVASVVVLTLVVVGVRAADHGSDTANAAAPSAQELDQLAATVTGDTTATTPGTTLTGTDRAGLRKLRDDLRAARALSGDERKAALAAIRTKAQAGTYGPGVQRRAERRGDRREVVRALLPDELKKDLAALKAAPQDQRAGMRAQIMKDALAGKYGADVQAAAQKIEQLHSS